MSGFVTFALESNIPGVNTDIGGEALAANMGELDTLAEQGGMRPLSTFVDLSPYAELLGEEQAPTWMSAADGYHTVSGVLRALAGEADDEDPVVKDLRTMEKALEHARDIQFHLELSI